MLKGFLEDKWVFFWGWGLSICYGLLSSCVGFLFMSLYGYWVHDLLYVRWDLLVYWVFGGMLSLIQWLNDVLQTTVTSLPITISDHSPLLCDTKTIIVVFLFKF